MTLIRSISGIRGTIGGKSGDALTPLDVVKYTAAYGLWIKSRTDKSNYTIVVGRDARISGEMVERIIISTLTGLGMDVVSLGLAATPTVEIAVMEEKADGGIIITASHNPKQWNALKLLNEKGEFLNDEDGNEVLKIAEENNYMFAGVDELGKIIPDTTYNKKHIDKIVSLDLVNIASVKEAGFRIVIDGVNSVGGIIIPELLKAIGVGEVIELFCQPDGHFSHNPEPLPEHLTELSKKVVENNADLGFVVDPDVDRLAIVSEDGTMFGEEYTLVAVSDYVLSRKKGNTVSNLSSSRALKEVTEKYGGIYTASAVGEVNVVKTMKDTNAVIGGEGNGGVIYPDLHYGRDALVGIALFLTHLAKKKMKCSELRNQYPGYMISKNKIQLTPGIDVNSILEKIKEKYANQPIIDVDGVRIDFDFGWVHLRESNTEPIIRIYAESEDSVRAEDLANTFIEEVKILL